MLVIGYLLLALLPILGIAYIVWDHKKKTARREAESAGRLQELLAATTQAAREERNEPVSTPGSPVPPVPEPARPARTEPSAAAPLYAARDRVLTPPQTLAYLLLRTGLPDHLVFARVTLASVLDAGPDIPAYARNEQIRRLAGHVVDFVVSDRGMKPLVVIKLNSPQDNAAPDEVEPARAWLAMAGVKYVELDATALPRKEGIRAVVLGESNLGTGAEAPAQAAS